MDLFLNVAGVTFAAFTLLTILLCLSRGLADACSKGFGLDAVIFYYLLAPSVAAIIYGGLIGWLAALSASMVFLYAFCIVHGAIHRRKGMTITGLLNRRAGFFRNQMALIVTLGAVPVFLQLRIAEIFLYPFLVWFVRFPRYNANEWVNVSRQKHGGLAGSDLIWCLYCDWMTGVYSLGAEMLRNVESFWCPVRFLDGKKCDNCTVDFPDLKVWADVNKNDVKPVVDLLKEKYFTGNRKSWSWFGHPDRKGTDAKNSDKE